MYRDLIIAGLIILLQGPSEAQNRTATEAWVTNRIEAVSNNLDNAAKQGINAHALRIDNPHETTPAQIGAVDATNHPAWITLADIPAQPTGPVVALCGTNGSEFVTLEPGDVLTLWRVVSTNAWKLAGTDTLLPIPFPLSDYDDGTWVVSMTESYAYVRVAFPGNSTYENNIDKSAYSLPFELWGTEGRMTNVVVTPATFTNLVSTGLTSQDLSNLVSRADLEASNRNLIQTYFVTSNAWFSVNFSNQTLSASIVSTNGTTNTVCVGGNGASVDPQALQAIRDEMNAGLSAKAPKAWGTLAPDGNPNPDPTFMTFMNSPATVFASGATWSSYGTYAVLCTPGSVAFASGTNGAFRIGPDSTNYFGYATGGSVTVGAVPDSIVIFGGGTPGGYAEIVYPYSGGDFPVIWFTPSLAIDFALQASPAWVDNLDGTATVTVPAESPAGFYKATTTSHFNNYFETAMPARFLRGVIGSPVLAPVVYDSTVEITAGGHTYRIPAQFVE